ncbi:MAG: DUF302 domain-containing protein [Gemmatimonadales bacterium]
MIRTFQLVVLSSLFLSPATPGTHTTKPKGLKSFPSTHTVGETADRAVNAIEHRGLRVLARIDHAANARSVGEQLRPTQLIIFGNPRLGTQLIQCSQTIAIDLPMKLLVWEDRVGKVWIGYNEVTYLSKRHDVRGCDLIVNQLKEPLETLARTAAGG